MRGWFPANGADLERGCVAIRVRQSDLSTWQRCPLSWRYQNIDLLQRTQGGSAVFGTLVHDCVLFMEENDDLPGALDRFRRGWVDPVAALGQDKGQIDYYERARSWVKFSELGEEILTNWYEIHRWDPDTVIAREYTFDVPIGNGNVLTGTVDKLAIRYMAALDQHVVLISDYKTNAKRPTYDWLGDNLQFTAYCYATLQPEFWTGIQNGDALHQRFLKYPRHGEWVQLQGPVRLPTGERNQQHYNRLVYAVDQFSESVAFRIFVPTINGDACRYCEYRPNCGLDPIPE